MNTNLKRLKVCGLEVHTVKKNIKNMHLGVYPPEGRIRVAAPQNMSDESIRLFVISKIYWINKQKAKYENQQRQSKREYISGESHYLFGDRYRLNIINSEEAPKVEIKRKTHIDLHIKPRTSTEKREEILDKFYREELKKIIPAMLNKWQNKIGVNVNEINIKKMKTKWGTCNSNDGRIWLNLELAKNPKYCVEYVLVHEMIHFFENTHSDRFYSLMDIHMPKWPQHRDELNNSVLGFFNWDY